MKKLRKVFYLLLFLMIFIMLLVCPKRSLLYALTGLQLWYEKMIPTLLPFMILSSLMIQLGINTSLSQVFSPVLRPLFQVNSHCIYGIIIGFFCGFPMGAKTSCELYRMQKITKQEAQYLLCFCNNIGPVYFISFVLSTMNVTHKLPFLIGMYGLPFLYGILLRYTLYRTLSYRQGKEPREAITSQVSLLEGLDDSIMGSLRQIAMLGGYMILFNTLSLLPSLFLKNHPFFVAVTNSFFEITSGVSRLFLLPSSTLVAYSVFTLLVFGGLSCMVQTYSFLKQTDLSFWKYILHKCILTCLAGVYYFFLLFL